MEGGVARVMRGMERSLYAQQPRRTGVLQDGEGLAARRDAKGL